MAQIKHEFFRKGADKQKQPDIVVTLKRVDVDKIAEWSVEEKEEARVFMSGVETVFMIFKSVITSS